MDRLPSSDLVTWVIGIDAIQQYFQSASIAKVHSSAGNIRVACTLQHTCLFYLRHLHVSSDADVSPVGEKEWCLAQHMSAKYTWITFAIDLELENSCA